MSYCSMSEAKALTGQDISQTLLDEARQIVDLYTEYRWENTTHTMTISGSGTDSWLELFSPIISVTSLSVDDIDLTEDTDFEIRKAEGKIRVYYGLPYGHDNIVITYIYGFQTTDRMYQYLPVVKGAEARIALFLMKNPGMLKSLSIEGQSIVFDDDHIQRFLTHVPSPLNFGVISPNIDPIGFDI